MKDARKGSKRVGYPSWEEYEERFWSRVKIDKKSKCWEWQFGLNGLYGQMSFEGNPLGAHVLAYMFTNGRSSIRKNTVICHTCDNPPCCNPNHLVKGTQSFNMLDMYKKKRSVGARGTKNGQTKFTPKDIKNIHKAFDRGATVKELAIKHKCAVSTMNDIKRGIRFKREDYL